jgi:NTP pyrophosphatase (non-canonical NTP hydrolase)
MSDMAKQIAAEAINQLRPMTALSKFGGPSRSDDDEYEEYVWDEPEDTFRDLINATLQWANDRNLLDNPNPDRQTLKMVEEVGEFVREVLKGNKESAKLEMGDVLVTCILTCAKLDLDLEDCLSAAYDKISKRTGKTVNGVFVKD